MLCTLQTMCPLRQWEREDYNNNIDCIKINYHSQSNKHCKWEIIEINDKCHGELIYTNNQMQTIHTMKLWNNECAQIGGREHIRDRMHCASGRMVNPSSALAMQHLGWYNLSRSQTIHTFCALWSKDVPPPPTVNQSWQCGAIPSPLHCNNIWEAHGDVVQNSIWPLHASGSSLIALSP
jgi:hypothetical protein